MNSITFRNLCIVNALTVDYRTGNIYFCQKDTQTIYVSNSNGTYVRELKRPTEKFLKDTFIQKITLDMINK